MDKRKQGIAGLRAPMARDVERLSQYSRGDDRNLAHVAPGDTIIPPELMRANPALAQAIFEALSGAGIDPAKRVVDSGAARRNPVTGAQEFDAAEFSDFGMTVGDILANLTGDRGYQDSVYDPIGYQDRLMQDYYNNVVSAGRGNVDPFGGYGAYAGATGGTGPITDETFYGDPTQRPDYTPDQPTPGPVVDLPVGDLGFDPSKIPNILDPNFRLPADYIERVREALEGRQGEAPVIGPEAPGAPPTTGGTPTPPAQPGRVNDLDPVLGIPPEILDMIDVGVELPIPGPGTELLPVILGSVGDIIEGIQYPVDPTTGQIPSSAGGQAAQAVENAVNSIMDSVRGAIRGATTGQVQEYVRNAVLAGEAVGDIINSVQEVFAAPEGPIPTPPSSGAPPTPAAPPSATGGRGGLEPDFALPGSQEEEEQAAAEAARRAAEEQAAAEAARRAEEQAAAEEAARRAEEQAAAEAARRAEEQAAAEAARRAAEEQAAAERAAREAAEQAAARAAERAAQEAAAAAERAAQQEAANAAVTGALDSVRDQVEAYRQEGLTGNQAVREAVDAVAEDLGMTREELLGRIGATEETILSEMEAQGAELRSEIVASRNAVLDQVAANEAAGMARDEALNDALQQVADDMGVAVEDLMGELGTTREELSGDIADLRAEGVAGRQAILDQVQANEAAGMARDEALNTALQQVADDMGVAVEDLMGELGTTREELSSDITDLGVRLAETETNILDQIAANEAAGMSRDEALDNAIGIVADDLGTTREALLDELGTTREDLRDRIGQTEERLGTQISDLGRQIGARDLVGMLSQPGVLSQQVDVGEAELADIGDLYDFSSIFRTPEQAERFATPYDNAEIERLLRELGVA